MGEVLNGSTTTIETIRRAMLIPIPIDQYPCAHSRNPMDMMRQG